MARTIFRRNDWLVLRRSAKYSWISSSPSDSGGSNGSFLKRFFVSGGGSGLVYSIHEAIMNPNKLLRNPAVNEMIWGSVIQSILCCQQIWKCCNPFFLSKNDITVYNIRPISAIRVQKSDNFSNLCCVYKYCEPKSQQTQQKGPSKYGNAQPLDRRVKYIEKPTYGTN